MLDGIEQPGDRRLMEDIAKTPQASADAWYDGYVNGLANGRMKGYVDAMMEAIRLVCGAGGRTANELVDNELLAIAKVLVGKTEEAINQARTVATRFRP